jgi:hypothetical protein
MKSLPPPKDGHGKQTPLQAATLAFSDVLRAAREDLTEDAHEVFLSIAIMRLAKEVVFYSEREERPGPA